MSPNEIKASALRLDAEAEEMRKRATVLINDWAQQVCPYKVDEVIECRGYAYRGKKMRVTSVQGRMNRNFRNEDNSFWVVFGVVLKADGTPSKHRHDFQQPYGTY